VLLARLIRMVDRLHCVLFPPGSRAPVRIFLPLIFEQLGTMGSTATKPTFAPAIAIFSRFPSVCDYLVVPPLVQQYHLRAQHNGLRQPCLFTLTALQPNDHKPQQFCLTPRISTILGRQKDLMTLSGLIGVSCVSPGNPHINNPLC